MPKDARRVLDRSLVIVGIGALVAETWAARQSRSVPVAVALAMLTCLPWLWRRRYATTTLIVNASGLIAAIFVLRAYDWASGGAVVLVFFVALDGDRRRALVVGAASAVILAAVLALLIPALERSDDLFPAGSRVLAALAALVIGDLVRSRLALRAAARAQATRELAELRERAERQAVAERLQIARELHDTLAHALVAINVRAGVSAHLGLGVAASEAMEEIKQVSAQALDDLRATLDVLRERDAPASRDPTLGLAAVPRLLDRAHAAGLDADVQLAIEGEPIPSVIDHAGFRIVQEAVTNILRHADASHAQVRVVRDGDALSIEITDDGRGAAGAGAAEGHGLSGMAERASALGGRVIAGPLPHHGWQVQATLPLSGSA